jgi:hypothetical protein
MRTFKGRKFTFTVVAALAALVFTGAGTAFAVATSKGGTTVTRTVVSTENAASVNNSPSFVTVRTISIYAQSSSFIVARWTAESACYGGSGYCSARIVIDGVEAEPVAGTDFAFNSTDTNVEGTGSWESLSMERTRTVTFTGSHAVTVQVAVVGTATHRYDDWTLTAQVIAP